jgi:hypothetical protein
MARHLNTRKLGRFLTFNGRESNYQFDSLILGPSFGHNLCFRCPNGSCKPILNIYISRYFQWYKKILNPMCFDPCNYSLKIWKSIEIPTPKVGTHFRTWKFIPLHSPTLPRAWDVTPGLPFWPTPLQALTLVTSLRLGLQQFVFNLHLKKLHSFNNP